VHRHSGASAVDICVRPDMEQVHLEISDDGRGIPKKQLAQLINGNGATSVSIAGMLERVRELGGRCRFNRTAKAQK
jgi:signal transduction histidine kinase